jgi:hypothetical protein
MLFPHLQPLPPGTGRTLRSSWPVHDDPNSSQTDDRSNNIKPVRNVPVKHPTPKKRQKDENASICGIDATEMAGWKVGIVP